MESGAHDLNETWLECTSCDVNFKLEVLCCRNTERKNVP